jgi:hypothetical protein
MGIALLSAVVWYQMKAFPELLYIDFRAYAYGLGNTSTSIT